MLYSKQNMLENMVTEQMLDKEKSNLIMVELLSHIVEFRNGESGMHVLNIRPSPRCCSPSCAARPTATHPSIEDIADRQRLLARHRQDLGA